MSATALLLTLLATVPSGATSGSVPDTTIIDTGRMLVEGRDMFPPFVMVWDGGNLTVNAIPVLRALPSPPPAAPAAKPNPTLVAQMALTERVNAELRTLGAQNASDAVRRKRAARLYRSSPLVASLSHVSVQGFMVNWRDGGVVYQFTKFNPTVEPDTLNSTERSVEMMKLVLRNRGMVIMSNGNLVYVPASRLPAALKEVEAIRRGHPLPVNENALPPEVARSLTRPVPADSSRVLK